MSDESDFLARSRAACCYTCEDEKLKGLDRVQEMFARTFIVCPDCGHKRCPKANQHDNACTNSNASGQPGSRYE